MLVIVKVNAISLCLWHFIHYFIAVPTSKVQKMQNDVKLAGDKDADAGKLPSDLVL